MKATKYEPLLFPFVERRTVGDCMSDGVAFLKLYRKPFLRFILVVLLPIALLHAVPEFMRRQQQLDDEMAMMGASQTYDYYYDNPDFTSEETDLYVPDAAFMTLALLALVGFTTALVAIHHGDAPRGDEDKDNVREVPVGRLLRAVRKHAGSIVISALPAGVVLWAVRLLCNKIYDEGGFAGFSLTFFFVLGFIIPVMGSILLLLLMSPSGNIIVRPLKKQSIYELVVSHLGSWLALTYSVIVVILLMQEMTFLPWELFTFVRETLLSQHAAAVVEQSWFFDAFLFLYTVLSLVYLYVSMSIALPALAFYGGNLVARAELTVSELNKEIEIFEQL